MSEQQFRRIQEHVIFRDDVLGLRNDLVETPSGIMMWRKVVEYHKAAAIVPLVDDSTVLLLRHFRYPVQAYIWEIPGGMIQSQETAIECAQREAIEETGYEIESVEHVIDFFPEPAFTDHVISIFVGHSILPLSSKQLNEEEIDSVGMFKVSEIARMIREGLIRSSWTIIGLTMVLSKFLEERKGQS